MTENENLLGALKEFTDLFTPMWFWKMDTKFNVLSSNCPHESLFKSILLKDGRREAMEAHMESSRNPVTYTVSSLISWIIAFSHENGNISNIYIMGPVFVGDVDSIGFMELFGPLNLTKEAEETVKENMEKLPVINATAVVQNAVILHYCITKEKISPSDVSAYVSKPKHQKLHRKIEANQFEKSSGRWNMEQELLNRIRNGDLSALEALNGAGQNQIIKAFGNSHSIHSIRQNIHQLLTLISRAAVEGGLPQRTSFSLCSEYRDKLEAASNINELEKVSNELVKDYAGRVHNMKSFSKCSPQIRLCCEYIDTHPGDKLTLEELAEKAGYSSFHLSRKFHQEMKCSIIEYIQRSKIERAKYLLSHTEESIDNISLELGFNSRTYFTTVFRNHTGVTPSDYRKENVMV